MPRALFQITGKDSRDFLQGLITNDVKKLDSGLVYAALLTPQGKYIADFFLALHSDAILLDVDATLAETLVPRLNMYRLRADVQITPSALQVSRGTTPPPPGALPDPRHAALGWRHYGETALPEDGTDWDALRVAHIIPQSGIELTADSYILEAGFERLNGVDFRKGCFVGQEICARMKHKTELRKGLVQVAINGAAEPGSDITANGKPAGTLFTRSGTHAIAWLRLDRASGEMAAGDATLRWNGTTT